MPVKSPRFALFDLAEGKSYSFRVRCCNSAGVGEPSESTREIVVGDKLGEPVLVLHTETPASVIRGYDLHCVFIIIIIIAFYCSLPVK